MMVIYFFFNDTATTEIYTLSLHDALPIWDRFIAAYIPRMRTMGSTSLQHCTTWAIADSTQNALCSKAPSRTARSEEHTSELQSRQYLVCRLLLEKKKTLHSNTHIQSL